jgi:aryl-alcohol dehydrogenase-like predicted oxidoreductase
LQYKQLGDSGLFVADLALGTMLFGEEDGRGTPPDVATQMLERYLDMGGNHIDRRCKNLRVKSDIRLKFS